ncbi:MAG: hypothetical protein HYV24_10205 [Deltaproteobacteria bacterium]|nr:hypothetical protein [Deltaproteobacteria bacterium]
MKKTLTAFIFVIAAFLTGCGGLNFSQVSPDAKDFSPSSIAVLPATVGEFESSRSTIDDLVSRKLLETGLFDEVKESATIKNQVSGSSEIASSMEGYIQRLNTLGISDAAVSSKLKDALHADAFFLAYVTSWGYGRQGGDKVARVGLGIRLINPSNGTIVWKANHELVEEYWMIKPDLGKLAEKLLSEMFEEMPLEKRAAKSVKAVEATPAAQTAPAPGAAAVPAPAPVATPAPEAAPVSAPEAAQPAPAPEGAAAQ